MPYCCLKYVICSHYGFVSKFDCGLKQFQLWSQLVASFSFKVASLKIKRKKKSLMEIEIFCGSSLIPLNVWWNGCVLKDVPISQQKAGHKAKSAAFCCCCCFYWKVVVLFFPLTDDIFLYFLTSFWTNGHSHCFPVNRCLTFLACNTQIWIQF